MNLKLSITYIIVAMMAIGFVSCGGGGNSADGASGSNVKKSFEDKVIVHNLSDPEGLHPICTSDASASEIKRFISSMLSYLDSDAKLVPILLKEQPTIEVISENQIELTMELKPEAEFADGHPVTPRDVEFTFMSIKNPKIDAASLRPYFDSFSDFIYFDDNPHKFKMIVNEKYFLVESVATNNAFIMAEHIFDPTGLWKEYHLKDFADPKNASKIANQTKMIAWAKDVNSDTYHREVIVGSGPYDFVSWETDRRIVLKRKADWWGNKYKGTNMFFDEGPETIIYETVNDWTTAVTALKGGKLDVISYMTRMSDWLDLDKSEKFTQNFTKYSPILTVYSYLGLHMKDPKFRGKKTRQALAHLVDADRINETLLYGSARRIVGPVLPSIKDAYHPTLKPREYSVEKAKKLLAEDGWGDSNGDGTLDKMIDGVNIPFDIQYAFNQGNDTRKNVGLLIQQTFKEVGIKLNVVSKEWSVYLDLLKGHKINMWYGAWVSPPTSSDPKQIWGSESYNGGSNYTGFGTAESDALIETIRQEMDPAARAKLYHQWQEMLHEEVPYIFLFNQNRRMILHNRFTNIGESPVDPGFWGGGLQIANGYKIVQ